MDREVALVATSLFLFFLLLRAMSGWAAMEASLKAISNIEPEITNIEREGPESLIFSLQDS